MNYCGMDIASVSSYVYLADKLGHKLSAGPVDTTEEALRDRLEPFVRRGLAIAIEAGNQTAWIYDVLVQMGAAVTVVHPAKVKPIAQSRRKTDKIDAKLLCDLLRLDALPHPVHMPSERARAVRGLLKARKQLISARTKLCNVVRGMLRQEGVRLPLRALSSYVGWQRVMAEGFDRPHVAVIVSTYSDSFVGLTRSIREVDRALGAQERTDARAARLRTMPKVGRITAMTTVGTLDEPGRFGSSRKVVSYSGLAPTVRSSGERTAYGPISREGRSELRAVWVQVAHLVVRDRRRSSQPLRTWYHRVARRRGKKTAIVALARKLLVIAYHILRDETVYDARRLKRAG
jgi:transposase